MDTKRNTQICIDEFNKFYDLLMKDAPEGYKPWFFPCIKNDKAPDGNAILKIDATSKKSWHHESARLSKEQAIEHIKAGGNIGISARKDDPLIIGDIDNEKYLNQLPKKTLTTTSRKRTGAHFFGWDKDGTAKINLPTGNDGEMRSDNQYVLAPGSFVLFDLTKKKDKEVYDNLPEKAKSDVSFCYYTIRDMQLPRLLSFEDLPQFFKDKDRDNKEKEAEIKQVDEFKEEKRKPGKYDELFKLKVSDIIGSIPASKRVSHPLHASDTDSNFSLSKDGTLGHCWRHLVSLNAVQYLCVDGGYANCEDAGTPHKGRGISKIKGDKKALEFAYNLAVKKGLINQKVIQTKKENPKTDIATLKKDFYKEHQDEEQIEIWEIDSKGKTKLLHKNLAKRIMQMYYFITIGEERHEILYYNEGQYIPGGTNIINKQSEILTNGSLRNNDVNEVIGHIKRLTFTNRDILTKTNTDYICVNNGILNIKTLELTEHNPYKIFTQKVPHDYNPDAKCLKIEKFLSEILRQKDIPVVQEFTGYLLLRSYFIKKALLLVGGTNRGKTTLINVVVNFIGQDNTSGLSLHKILTDKFATSNMFSKLLNFYDDLSFKDIKATGQFKIATGGGYISAEKKFGECYQFMNYAKLMFATNKISDVEDTDDDAYYSRWLNIFFNNVFDNDNPKTDKNIITKLIAKKEMEGFLNWALIGLKRLFDTHKFSYDLTAEENKVLMEYSSNPISAFVQDCLIQKNDSWITKEDMYKVYSFYINKKGGARVGIKKFGGDLPTKNNFIAEARKTIDKKKGVKVWSNVSFDTLNTQYFEIIYNKYNNIKNNKNINHNTNNNIIFPLTLENGVYRVFVYKENENEEKQQQKKVRDLRSYTEKRTDVFSHISENPECSFLDIQNASELSEKDIQEELKKLKSDGHIFEPKNDKYVVLE